MWKLVNTSSIPLGCGWGAPYAQQHGVPCGGPEAEGWAQPLPALGNSRLSLAPWKLRVVCTTSAILGEQKVMVL